MVKIIKNFFSAEAIHGLIFIYTKIIIIADGGNTTARYTIILNGKIEKERLNAVP
jgi:hypothetical protein